MTQPLPDGPCFDKIALTDSQRAFCHKILSSDALAALLIDRIKRHIPTSLVRMSDGERAYMAHARGEEKAGFMRDPQWLARYGLTGCDARKVGGDLLWAGNEADFLACTISGLFWNIYELHPYFPNKPFFIDQFWPQLMASTDRVGALLRSGPVLVLHREQHSIVPVLRERYGLVDVNGMELNSWKDHEWLMGAVATHHARIVLVSGGASGKAFIVRLAKHTGKVVLDVGEAMQGCWVK